MSDPTRAAMDDAEHAALVALLRDDAAGAADTIRARVDRHAPAPLSFAQQRLWFLHGLEPENAAYNSARAFRLCGALDVAALEAAFRRVIERHAILRTRIADGTDGPCQFVLSEVSFAIEADPDALDAAAVEGWLRAGVRRPFDLGAPPLVRASLARIVGSDDRLLLVVLHHIAVDAWSAEIILADLERAYGAALAAPDRRGPSLSAPAIDYADYALWQRERFSGSEADAAVGRWRRRFGPYAPALELPADRPRGDGARPAGRFDVALAEPAVADLRAFCRREGCTPFVALLAAWQLLLGRLSGQDDFAVGVPNAARGRADTQDVVGFFVNTQPFRARLDPALTVRALCARLRQETLEALDDADLPLEILLDHLAVERDARRTPLFQTLFNFRPRRDARAFALSGLDVVPVDIPALDAQFDLTLDVAADGDSVDLQLEYDVSLFAAETIARWAAHFQALLGRMIAFPDATLGSLSTLDAASASRLENWSAPGWTVDADGLFVHERIAAWAEMAPERTAVIFGESDVSRGALDARVEAIAQTLLAAGVRSETIVGVALKRSPDLIAAYLATLRIGAAFLPLPLDWPRARLAETIADIGASAVLVDGEGAALLADVATPIVQLNSVGEASGAPSAARPHPESLAYVIMTSGSTGKPKGVGVAHGALAAHIASATAAFELSETTRELHMLSFAFDAAHERWLSALGAGGSLILKDDDLWEPERTLAAIEAHGVTNVDLPPAYLAELASFVASSGAEPPALDLISFGGEATSRAGFERLRSALRPRLWINGYGPTEAVVTPLLWKVEGGATFEGPYAPIGRAIGARRIGILDRSLQPVPQGVTGELYIGGDILARGYLERPALTAERFVPDPQGEPGARMYRTGDLARWGADGAVHYLGRSDEQVKIRGYRIELGEVEAALLGVDGVREAVAVAAEGGPARRLVAYVVTAADKRSDAEVEADLKATLGQRLPGYMVPSRIVRLDRLPRLAGGKIDRRSLPEPDAADGEPAGRVAPENEIERTLAAVWADVLGVADVGVTDNFFELGGDSILSLQVVSRARAAGLSITAKQVFERQTVRELAGVAGCSGTALESEARAEGEAPLSPIQHWFFAQDMPRREHWNQSVELVASEPVDEAALDAALRALVDHHDALRLRFTQGADGVWRQRYAPASAASGDILRVTSIEGEHDLAALAERSQTSLDLAMGPTIRADLARLPDGSSRLLIVVHHLAVDGVSWRVLLEDLERAYAQALAGEPILLAPKTTPFGVWTSRLAALATGPDAEAELDWWREAVSGAPAFPSTRPNGSDRVGAAARRRVRFDAVMTARYSSAPREVRARLDELLLAALARALCARGGVDAVTVALESHGRDGAIEGADVSRTVGWFTSLFPVRLQGAGEPLAVLKAAKERLRTVPGKGLGYGALRWLGREEVREELARAPEPQVVFNHLGRFDGADGDRRRFAWTGRSAGADYDDGAPLGAELTVNSRVHDGALTLDVIWSSERHEAEAVDALIDVFRRELEAIAAACLEPDAAGLTPSDVALAKLDQRALDALVAASPHDPRDILDLYPLSPMQDGMLFHGLQTPELYVTQTCVAAEALNHARFADAWTAAVSRHAALRTGFVHGGLERPLQFVLRSAPPPVETLDWRGRAGDVEAELARLADADRRRGFDLARPPLLRVLLVRLDDRRTRVILTCHHLILDGWSTSRLIGEVLARYEGRTVPPVGGLFRDHVAWLEGLDPAASERFWRERLAPLDEPTLLAAALPKSTTSADEFGHERWSLDLGWTERLKAFARGQRVTLNMLVHGAWTLLLSRHTGHSTVAFGATASGRSTDVAGVETALGLFINTLIQVETVTPSRPAGEWLRDLQARAVDLREHEHAPLYAVQGWAGRAGQAAFDTLLVFENYPVAEALKERDPETLRLEPLSNVETTNYPLAVTVAEKAGGLEFGWTWRSDAFDRATVERLHARLARLLDLFVEHPSTPIGAFDLLDGGERRTIAASNATARGYEAAPNILALIARQAQATPTAAAVTVAGAGLSYAELDAHTSRLAHRLTREGVGPDGIVGVAMERSVDLVVALLGVMKAGAAYLPLDPEHPAERLAEMARDAGARLALTETSLLARGLTIPGLDMLAFETLDLSSGPVEAPAPELHADSLAYVIFTSGSTGKPKGVGNTHRGLLNRLQWMQERYGLTSDDVVLQKTPFGFDVSVWEFFWPLMVGARLEVAPPDAHRDPQALGRLIRTAGVTTAHFVPSMLAAFVAAGEVPGCASLKRILCSGEALPHDLQQATLAQTAAELHNLYGPTEAAIDVTHWECRDAPDETSVPIGRPIANTAIRILDMDLNLLPPGVAGELAIAGDNLARGYLGRPALTAERFAPDPEGPPGARLYVTGDLARLRPDGAIDYLGRLDRQLKLRGMRIEPGEIEAELRRSPGVRDAAVVLNGDRLVGYVATGDAAAPVAESDLKRALALRLPAHMVPSRIVAIPTLPLSRNGKLDRAALPAPDALDAGSDDAPRTASEEGVARIWRETLGLESVGRNADFFEHGGHSLLAARVIARLRQEFGVEPPLAAMFEARTVAALAALVDELLAAPKADDVAAMTELLDALEFAE